MLFMAYQRPDWTTQWTDQDGYRRLAEVLASTGKFTRYPDAPQFVPEVIRTPVYPAFVAVIYRVFGETNTAVAAVQVGVFVLICLTVFAIARQIGGPRLGIAAAGATALFPTLPYFAALVLTEVWTTLMFTLTMWLLVRAVHEQRPGLFAGFGVLAAVTDLEPSRVRPVPAGHRRDGARAVSADRLDPAAGVVALGPGTRGVRGRDAAVVHVQLRHDAPVHACRPPAASAAASGKARGRDTGRVACRLS